MSRTAAFVAVVAAAATGDSGAAASTSAAVKAAPTCRDRIKQPFASTSIWNTPLGSAAAYAPAYIFNQSAYDPAHACAVRVTTPHLRSQCPGSNGGTTPAQCAALGCCYDDSVPGVYTCFQPAGGPPLSFHNDADWFIVAGPDDPLTPFVDQGGWYAPTFPYCNITGSVKASYPFPPNATTLCIEDNNSAGLLLPDNITLIQFQPYYRQAPGSPILGLYRAESTHGYPWSSDIRGDGAWGAHGGSSLSSIGGTIRSGELLPDAPPIPHALKLELFAHDWEWNGGTSNTCQPGGDPAECCYMWPALNCDGYARDTSGSNAPLYYNGTNPLLKPGSLLAVPPALAPTVNVTTLLGQKFLAALSTYGGYIVDDTAWPTAAFCAESAVNEEVLQAYNITINLHAAHGGTSPQYGGATEAFYWDLVRIFQALHVVTNNSNSTRRGGGQPVVPVAPPLCE